MLQLVMQKTTIKYISVYALKQHIHNTIRDNILKYSSNKTMQQLTVNKKQLQKELRSLEKAIKKIIENGSMGTSTKLTNVQDKVTLFMFNNNLM